MENNEDIKIVEEFINNYKEVQEKYKDDEIQAEIERSKDTNIIYSTEDIVLNTNCVKQLAEYLENLLSRLKTAEKELEKYKDVTYFEKLEDGNLYKIDKERADDLYKHGNGCWLYIQMWARKKVEENV